MMPPVAPSRFSILPFLNAWPGNVRELQDVPRSVIVPNTGDEISRDMLPDVVFRRPAGAAESGNVRISHSAGDRAHAGVRLRPLWQVEREMIDEALRGCDGGVPRAAAILEMSPSTIYRRIRKDGDGEEAGLDVEP